MLCKFKIVASSPETTYLHRYLIWQVNTACAGKLTVKKSEIWKEGKIKHKNCLGWKKLSITIEEKINSKLPWFLTQLGGMRNSAFTFQEW